MSHQRVRRPVVGPAPSTPQPLRRRLRVGAVDDPAERAADRVAADVVARLAERRGSTDHVFTPATSRIAPKVPTQAAGDPVVRRHPYLADQATRRYRDTSMGARDLAYLGQPRGLAGHTFVDYAAVGAVHQVIKKLGGARSSGGPARSTRRTRAQAKTVAEDFSRPKQYGLRTGRLGLDLGDDYMRLSDRVNSELTPPTITSGRHAAAQRARRDEQARSAVARELRDALGAVLVWVDGDRYQDVTAELADRPTMATIVMLVAYEGPTTMAAGSGSRLPAAQGELFTTPAMTRGAIMQILGVEETAGGVFTNVTITGLDADDYVEAQIDQRAKGANLHVLEDPASRIFMFYRSDVQVGLSANRKITIAGRDYDQAALDALDSVRDAGSIAAMASSFAALGVRGGAWIPGTKLQVPFPREQEQNTAMGNWSALGAAAYANRFLGRDLDVTQNWEWLHVQGAQIGGPTVNGNLVPGFFTANSAMIPFENLIRSLALEDPLFMEARFEPRGGRDVFVDRIVLSVRGIEGADPVTGGRRGHLSLGVQERVLMEFDPLHGRVVDKVAGLLTKRQVDRTGVR